MRAHCYWNASFDFNLCHVYVCLVSRTKLRTNKINFRILIHDMFNHLKLTLSCFVSLLQRARLFTPNITCILSEWKQILCVLLSSCHFQAFSTILTLLSLHLEHFRPFYGPLTFFMEYDLIEAFWICFCHFFSYKKQIKDKIYRTKLCKDTKILHLMRIELKLSTKN